MANEEIWELGGKFGTKMGRLGDQYLGQFRRPVDEPSPEGDSGIKVTANGQKESRTVVAVKKFNIEYCLFREVELLQEREVLHYPGAQGRLEPAVAPEE